MAIVRGKIAAVSYLNTVPFVYGINHAGLLHADLLLSPPSECAKAFADGLVDIALVPVGALSSLNDAEIVTTFCIGCDNDVRTVVLVSDSPFGQIRNIYLDSHSLTSVRMARILAGELWNIRPAWHDLSDYNIVDNPQQGDAFVLIGDKVFGQEGKFRYSYDMASEWRKLTGSPAIFAVWIARQGTDPDLIDALEDSLEFGVERIWEALAESGRTYKERDYFYLTENIDFLLDAPKRAALDIFREKSRRLDPHANPG